MKHLPIGKIREIKHNDKLVYDVSLFHNQVHEVFEEKLDAIELMQHHADSFLRLGETDAICVEYYNEKNQMHYIMMDTIWGDRNKPQVHEQTRYEYMQSHSLYFPRWSSRRVINERHISASDVLRSSINYRPWYSVMHIVLSLLIAAFSIVYIVEAVYYIHEEIKPKNSTVDLWLALGLFAFGLLGALFTVTTMYLTRKKLVSTGYDYSEINWHKWYKIRFWTSIVFFILSTAALVVLGFFSYEHIREDFQLAPDTTTNFHEKTQLLISIYALFVLFGISFFSMAVSIVYVQLHKAKVLRTYFTPEQRKKFKKWMKNPKEREVVYKAGRDFFILPPEASEYPVVKELQISKEIRLKYAPDEYREYKAKAVHHFHEAMKTYIRRLREAQLDNLSKNNQ